MLYIHNTIKYSSQLYFFHIDVYRFAKQQNQTHSKMHLQLSI